MASSESDSSYEVDTILNQRKRKGVLEYLVRWRGFGKEEDSWEPAKNLGNCAAALAAYLKLTASTKTPKKSSRSTSRSRSRSRSRTTREKSSRSRTPRARSRTPRARSRTPKASSRKPSARTPRSRSRSSSRGRTTQVKESPSRQAKKTEIVTKTSTNREPGRVEKKTEIVRHTRDESKPDELKTTRVYRSRLEVKTVEDKVDGKLVAAKSEGGIANTLHTMWQTADTAVLILFVCVSIIALSYVVENYCSPSDIWKYVVGMFTAIVGAITAFCQMVCGATGRMWETAANFTRNSWKKVTTN